jgi:glutamate 5-kinase
LTSWLLIHIESAPGRNGSSGAIPVDRSFEILGARQIANLREQGREVVLVSSGAILAGNQMLGRRARQTSIAVKQALAAIGQVELMGHWRDIFSWHEIRVAQVLLTQDDIAHRKRFLNARHTW